MYKKLLSWLLAVAMIVTSAPIVIADDPWDDNAGGGGSTGDVGGGTFSMNDQGLRVSLYDGENTLEALGDNAVIDVWYYSKPSGAVMLGGGNNKKGVPASNIIKESLLSEEGLGGMPMPIGWDNATGSFTAQGEAIRDYLLGDGSYHEPPSGSGGSGGSSGGTPIIWSGGGSSGGWLLKPPSFEISF